MIFSPGIEPWSLLAPMPEDAPAEPDGVPEEVLGEVAWLPLWSDGMLGVVDCPLWFAGELCDDAPLLLPGALGDVVS